MLEIARAQYRPNTDIRRYLGGANRVSKGPVPQRAVQDLADDHTEQCDQRQADQAEAREKADGAPKHPHVFLLGRPPRRDQTNRVAAYGPVVARGPIRRKLAPTQTSIAGGDLLHRPAVPVGITEEDERSPRELLDLADLHAALAQRRMGDADIGDDELQSLYRAGCGVRDSLSERDRARRPGRCQLHIASRH